MTDDKQRVAYHEAAHAVVALLERVKVYSATIIPSDEAEGVTRHHNLLYGRGVEWDASHPNRIRMERLVRMALEQVWQNRAQLQSLDAIAREIARIIFGDTNTSDLNVRLVKMALERSNSIALFKAA